MIKDRNLKNFCIRGSILWECRNHDLLNRCFEWILCLVRWAIFLQNDRWLSFVYQPQVSCSRRRFYDPKFFLIFFVYISLFLPLLFLIGRPFYLSWSLFCNWEVERLLSFWCSCQSLLGPLPKHQKKVFQTENNRIIRSKFRGVFTCRSSRWRGRQRSSSRLMGASLDYSLMFVGSSNFIISLSL